MNKKMTFYYRFTIMLCMTVSSLGCGTIRYLFQAGRGQLELSNRSKPIANVIKDEYTDPDTKKLLSQVENIKKFGETYGLKPTKNYTEYVKLDRPYAVWVVSACEVLKFRSKEWAFPFFGSFTYLGWFNKENAENFAEELKKEGWDVNVRGAGAYSTIGWFRDAVLSSMFAHVKTDSAYGALANVVLHESTHATLYLNDQAYFNESLASFVADYLTPTYLEKFFGKTSKEYNSYKESEVVGGRTNKVFLEAYSELQKLYQTSLSEDIKLRKKQEILKNAQDQLGLKKEINNATLVQYRTYGVGQEEFSRILKSCEFNWQRFWQVMRKIQSGSFGKKHEENLGSVLLSFIEGSGCH
ncbi:MAG: aminopeptidase [Bdellovibrio sp.]|nr:aminopeptidase [Bdellovibrio sp.]